MTRDDVFGAIRDHLADELELDPARDSEETRFKEDLDADSLDLYTLVQELEDSYGIKMPEEEAAKILTVGAAIDFVRRAATSSPRAKAGGALLRPALRGLRSELDPEGQGGAYLLGLRKLFVVPHGSFGAKGFEEAIVRADRGVREDVIGRTYATLDAAGALRRVPASDAATTFPAS